MEFIISFYLQGKVYSATCHVCQSKLPFYVYISFAEKEMMDRYGDEVCLHTDGKVLFTRNIPVGQEELYEAMFISIKRMFDFKQTGKTLKMQELQMNDGECRN